MRTAFLGLCMAAIMLTGCMGTHGNSSDSTADMPPAAPREFRGVWVATVGNIDWPDKPGEATEQQQREAIAILDKCAELNINAVILQVRPAADALYASKIEPWSYYLTGEQGKAPEPFYDPLAFWVSEAHKRGIELHAWFNPFRARAGSAKYKASSTHVSEANPKIVREFNGWQWMDPAEQAAQDQTFRVFMDVAKRYDVDGLHIDDYFYPYPEYLKNEPFPDNDSWQRYQAAGGKMNRDDWRRENINKLIHRVYDGLKREKKQVKFGISPFGIGHNRPAVVKGFDQYEKLFADAELWLKEGWSDYFTPQIYWKTTATSQPFEPLVNFWVESNPLHRNIWPGLATYKATEEEATTQPASASTSRRSRRATSWDVEEIIQEVNISRDTPGASGAVHFSMKSLMNEEKGVGKALRNGPYKDPALVPASPWLDGNAPAAPTVKAHVSGDGLHAEWTPGWFDKPWQWAVWVKQDGQWKFNVLQGDARSADFAGASAVCVSAVDRCGNESKRVKVEISK